MPPAGYEGRALMIYFSSKKELNDLIDAASKARVSSSMFAQEMIRLGMDQPKSPRGDPEGSAQAREEISRLRRELKEKNALMEKMESEIFALRHQGFATDRLVGQLDLSNDLIEFLQTGKTYRSNEIMKALGIDAKNIDAIKALAGQLHALEDLKLLEESQRGWKWVG